MTNPELHPAPKYHIEKGVRDLGSGHTHAEVATAIEVGPDTDQRDVGQAVTVLRRELPGATPSPRLHLLYDAGKGRKVYYTASYPGENLSRLPALRCELEETENGLRAAEAVRIDDISAELTKLAEGELMIGLYAPTYPDSSGTQQASASLCDTLDQARLAAEGRFQVVRRALSGKIGSVAALSGLDGKALKILGPVFHTGELS